MLNWEPAIDEHGIEHPHLLRLSEEAYSEHHAFAQAIEVRMQPGQELEQFTDWAGKAPGAAARLAGVLHGIKHAHGKPWEATITAETLTSALDIMAVISHHSLAALSMMGADPTIAAARVVWDWIERSRLERFTVREAFNALRGTFPRVTGLREALDVLEERGYLEVFEPPREGPGRPPSPPGTGQARACEGLAMNWRETLGVTASTESPYTQNTHNVQNPTEMGNCAHYADCASRASEQEHSHAAGSPG